MHHIIWLTEAVLRIYAPVNKIIIVSDNGLLLVRHQAVIWICCFIVNPIHRKNFSAIWIKKTKIFIDKNAFENIVAASMWWVVSKIYHEVHFVAISAAQIRFAAWTSFGFLVLQWGSVSGVRHIKRNLHMMTSSNGDIFRIADPLCGEFTGHRWIPPHKGQWRGALMFSLIYALNKRLSKQSWVWWLQPHRASL